MPQGNVSALATSRTHSGTRRLWRCRTGATHCAETRATGFCELRPSAEQGLRARKRLRVRGARTGLGLVLGVTAATGLAWLRRAAPQAAVLHHPLRRPLPVPQGPLAAMGPWIARQPARETDEAGESVPASTEGRPGVGGRLAPAGRWR